MEHVVRSADTCGEIVSVCLDLSPSHGGMYRGVIDIASMLGSRIISLRDGSGLLAPDTSRLQVASIDCTQVPKCGRAFRLPRRLRNEFLAALEGARMIIAHSLFRAHAMLVHEFSRSHNVPYVIVPHGALEPALWRSQRWYRLAWMWAGGRGYLEDASAVVFATDSERSNAMTTLGWAPRSTVIPFPVDAASSTARDDAKANARRRFGLPLACRILVVLGRLDPVKRPRQIIDAFCHVNDSRCCLVFVGGDGEERATQLAKLVPADFRSRIHFLGHLGAEPKAQILAACDGYLSWSLHESFGYAAAESMAAGLPVILPATHPLAPDVRTAECGIVTIEASRRALAGAIGEFARWSPEEIRRRGTAGRQFATSHWSRPNVRGRWNELLGALACVNRHDR